ncbi:MAG: thiolase family protein [Propionibacteriaceae bacterium]
MRDVFICAAVRTPVGRYGGALSGTRPDDLAALVVRTAVERAGVQPDSIDEVILGNANGAGEENRNVARMAVLLAGLPITVPGITVNRLCASGMSALAQASWMIRAGAAEVVVAGGVESMTRAPWVMEKPARPWARPGEVVDTSIGWRFTNPRFSEGDLSRAGKMTFAMPETAEEVARVHGISREDCDAFALRSHQRALHAQSSGFFAEEIVPVEVAGRKGATSIVTEDEGPRADSSLAALAALRPVVRGGSVVTAGNSSSLNDGASALLVASGDAVRQQGLTPLARFRDSSSIGLEPELMGMGPVPATRKLLAKERVSLDAVAHVELNEAFASQSLACLRELGLGSERVNPDGGAIALGHPLGSSGARLVVSLVHRMNRERVESGALGLATMCVGVGQGTAALIESI